MQIKTPLGRTLKSDLKNKEFELNRQTQNLPRLVENILSKNNSNLKQLEQSIKLMDPVHVLKRGYSITLIDGKTITNESKIKQGTTLITKTYFGEIESEILKIKDNKI